MQECHRQLSFVHEDHYVIVLQPFYIVADFQGHREVFTCECFLESGYSGQVSKFTGPGERNVRQAADGRSLSQTRGVAVGAGRCARGVRVSSFRVTAPDRSLPARASRLSISAQMRGPPQQHTENPWSCRLTKSARQSRPQPQVWSAGSLRGKRAGFVSPLWSGLIFRERQVFDRFGSLFLTQFQRDQPG